MNLKKLKEEKENLDKKYDAIKKNNRQL